MTVRGALPGAVLALALVATGCGGDDGTDQAEPAAQSSPGASSTVEVPDSVELDEPGTELGFGETATVVHEPTLNRGSVLDLTVTRVQRARLADLADFSLDERARASTPYYVEVSVENVGEGDLGRARVPLWAVDGDGRLVQASGFTAAFDPCPSGPLPEPFGPGDSVETCLVYLLPDRGRLDVVSYRPTQDFTPITWEGEVADPPKQERRKRRDR